MKNKILFLGLLLIGISLIQPVSAEEQEREVSSFSKISLRISANVHVEQGSKQSVRVEAKSSALEDLITEVKNNTLIIRLPNNFLFRNYNTGRIDVYIIVPEIDGLSVSGSGDIIAGKVESKNIDFAVSGSGNIRINNLKSERISASISGSGGINIDDGDADELKASISGSGDVKASGLEVDEISARIAGSGNCSVKSNGSIDARIAGSGNIFYSGNPSIDSSVAGSGRVRKL